MSTIDIINILLKSITYLGINITNVHECYASLLLRNFCSLFSNVGRYINLIYTKPSISIVLMIII